jgi:hypothetical protein
MSAGTKEGVRVEKGCSRSKALTLCAATLHVAATTRLVVELWECIGIDDRAEKPC